MINPIYAGLKPDEVITLPVAPIMASAAKRPIEATVVKINLLLTFCFIGVRGSRTVSTSSQNASHAELDILSARIPGNDLSILTAWLVKP